MWHSIMLRMSISRIIWSALWLCFSDVYKRQVVDGEVFYRENSVMTQVELSDTAKGRVTGMVELVRIPA